MFTLLLSRELRSLLFGPRFLVVTLTAVVLVVASSALGVQEYQQDLRVFEAAVALDREAAARDDGGLMGPSVQRAPEPMTVFVSGLHNDVGRSTPVSTFGPTKLLAPKYLDEPVFALFRPLDVAFVVQFVLSLLAIVLSFDAVCGDKQRGTLRLVASNPIPRSQIVLTKLFAVGLAVAVSLTLAILSGILVVSVLGGVLTTSVWMRVLGLFALSLVYLLVFATVGVLVSTRVHRPSSSFMILLVLWIGWVLIIPNASVLATTRIVEVTPTHELGELVRSFRSAQIEERVRRRSAVVDERIRVAAEGGDTDQSAVQAEYRRQDREHQEFKRRQDDEYSAFSTDLFEQRAAQQRQFARTSLAIARISPAATYRIASTRLAGTGIGFKRRFEAAINEFRDDYYAFIDANGKPPTPGEPLEPVDYTLAPQFQQPKESASVAVEAVLMDGALLVLFVLIAFAGAWVGFLRYDVR